MTDNLTTERVTIPLAQAGVTGVLSGLALGAGAVVWSWPHPFALGGMGASIVTLGAWLIFRSEAMPHQVEQLTPALALPVEVPTVRLELAQFSPDGYGSVDWLDSPLPLARLVVIARAWQDLGDVYRFSTSRLGGRGKCATRSEVEAVRDFLISRQFASRENGAVNSSCIVSWQGRAVLRAVAELDPDNPIPTPRAAALIRNLLARGVMQTHTHAQTDGLAAGRIFD